MLDRLSSVQVEQSLLSMRELHEFLSFCPFPFVPCFHAAKHQYSTGNSSTRFLQRSLFYVLSVVLSPLILGVLVSLNPKLSSQCRKVPEGISVTFLYIAW